MRITISKLDSLEVLKKLQFSLETQLENSTKDRASSKKAKNNISDDVYNSLLLLVVLKKIRKLSFMYGHSNAHGIATMVIFNNSHLLANALDEIYQALIQLEPSGEFLAQLKTSESLIREIDKLYERINAKSKTIVKQPLESNPLPQNNDDEMALIDNISLMFKKYFPLCYRFQKNNPILEVKSNEMIYTFYISSKSSDVWSQDNRIIIDKTANVEDICKFIALRVFGSILAQMYHEIYNDLLTLTYDQLPQYDKTYDLLYHFFTLQIFLNQAQYYLDNGQPCSKTLCGSYFMLNCYNSFNTFMTDCVLGKSNLKSSHNCQELAIFAQVLSEYNFPTENRINHAYILDAPQKTSQTTADTESKFQLAK